MEPIEPAADPREQYNEQRLSEYRESMKRKRKPIKKSEFEKELKKATTWFELLSKIANAKDSEKEIEKMSIEKIENHLGKLIKINKDYHCYIRASYVLKLLAVAKAAKDVQELLELACDRCRTLSMPNRNCQECPVNILKRNIAALEAEKEIENGKAEP